MDNTKQQRILEIFFRGLRGESLSVKRLAEEYGVSSKSITRSLNELKAFLADHRELVGNAELLYSFRDKSYSLNMDEFLTNEELLSVVEVLIGARAFSKNDLLMLVDKLKHFTTVEDRPKINELIKNEIFHYPEVKHDCKSVRSLLWRLVDNILDRREITIDYYKMDRSFVTHRLRPITVMFTDYYFYLIAFKAETGKNSPIYFRVDRIKHLTEHRTHFSLDDTPEFDEGLLRRRSLFMWPGKLRRVKFEFSGPSVQAVLDKLPTASIVERYGDNKYLIEAETYGDGIKMWLLSQGSWVKVVYPEEFVLEMKKETEKMYSYYN